MTKLQELRKLAEMEYPENIREWGWCTHRRKILKLISVVELQAKALDHYSFMGEFASFYVSSDGQDIADRAKVECDKLLDSL